MVPRRLLVAVSAGQLAAGLAGLAVALRRRRPYDIPLLRGTAARVARDSLWIGTAYSAPTPMLLAQAAATVQLARRQADGSRRLLGRLGALMAPGYLLERSVRAHLSPSGADPVETPVVAAGLGLAVAMAVLGHRSASAG